MAQNCMTPAEDKKQDKKLIRSEVKKMYGGGSKSMVKGK